MVKVRWSKARPGRRRTTNRILMTRIEIGRVAGDNGSKLFVFINGRHVKVSQVDAALLACLNDNAGRLVPYERLYSALQFRSSTKNGSKRHILRQHMWSLKRLLEANNSRCAVALLRETGYVLCEIDRLSSPPAVVAAGGDWAERPVRLTPDGTL